VQVFTPGKNDALVCVLEENRNAFLFDMPKSREAIPSPHEFLKKIKNGVIMSSKCQPVQKLPLVPNVVIVFSNHLPHTGKLSLDRYNVHYKKGDEWVPAVLNVDHKDAFGEDVYNRKIRYGENGVEYKWNNHQKAEVMKCKRQEQMNELTELRLKKARREEEEALPHSRRSTWERS